MSSSNTATTDPSEALAERIKQAEKTIAAARTKLILDKPFLGALVLRLPLQAGDPSWCRTTATDARKFYYNLDYILQLNPSELQFTLAHEALHCGLSHFYRKHKRNKNRWDLACDYAINPLLKEEGLSPPPGSAIMHEYKGMSAEEIYPMLDDNPEQETLDQHMYDKPETSEGGQEQQNNPLDDQPPPPSNKGKGNGDKDNSSSDDNDDTPSKSPDSDSSQDPSPKPELEPEQHTGLAPSPPPLSHDEQQQLALQWQQRLAGAAQQAMLANKLSAVMQRLIKKNKQHKQNWRALLSQYLMQLARDDYSYQRPNQRRNQHSSSNTQHALFPSLHSKQGKLLVAFDVSGSIKDKEVGAYLSEINSLKAHIHAELDIAAFDSELIEGFPKHYDAWQNIDIEQRIQGGGSTDFRPIFNWLNQQDSPVDCAIILTDGLGVFPPLPPHMPVLWLIKGQADVPWGTRVQWF